MPIPRVFCALTLVALCVAGALGAHCQVPCGIYDDAARIASIREDTTTIEKASKNIRELSGKKDAQSMNQLVRWVNTKEAHASHIIEVISEYFLTQKLKPAKGDETQAYLRKLAAHHFVLRAAMKTKQSTEQAAVDELRSSVDSLAKIWVPAEKHDHSGHDHAHGEHK